MHNDAVAVGGAPFVWFAGPFREIVNWPNCLAPPLFFGCCVFTPVFGVFGCVPGVLHSLFFFWVFPLVGASALKGGGLVIGLTWFQTPHHSKLPG